MKTLYYSIIVLLTAGLLVCTTNSVYAQDLTATCRQELNFCEIVYQGTMLTLNDQIRTGIMSTHSSTIRQMYDNYVSSGPYNTFDQVNQSAYFLKINHLDPSTRVEFSPLTLEVLEYNKSGLSQYLGNVYEFASIPNFEPDDSTNCSPENLDYYKKIYNSMMYSINGYFVTYEIHGQNMTVNYVNDELFRMAKYGAYDKVNEASYCLGVNDVNRSSLVQPLADTVKILNYDTAKMRQYLPVFIDHAYYLQQYKETDKQLQQLITQTSVLKNQVSTIESESPSNMAEKTRQLQQQIDENNSKKQSLINELDLIQNESSAVFQVDPVTKKKLDDAQMILDQMYLNRTSETYVGDNPVQEIAANYEYKNLWVSFDPDKTINNPTGDASKAIIITIKKVAGDIPLKISYGKIELLGGNENISNSIKVMPVISPLKQFKSGIAANDVKCEQGLQLVIRAEDNSPACVKPQTAQKLVERGWTKEISYATPTNSTSNMQQDQVTNLPSGLQLSLYVGPSTIHAGQPIVIDMFLRNTLSKLVVVPVENHWAIKAAGLEYCIPNPAGLAILKGYYTKDNMTQGKLLWFYDPYVTCPAVSYNIENYQFDPMSSHAKSANCVTPSYEAICNINTSKYIATKGYWTIENGFHTFDLGNYTVVGAEQSGYTVIQHFTVVNSTETYTTNNQPITVQTNDVRGTIKDIMTDTTFTELASSSTGIHISRGGGFDSYDNDSIKLELYHGKTSDSHVIAVTVKNTGKRTVHIYDIDISGFIPITNDSSQNIIVVKDDPSIVPKEDAILEPGESQTKYIVGNWTVGGKPVNGFSAGMSYSYDDLQNYDGITNGYTMSVPVQWIQK